jgi:predicted nucleic acid-binding protein
MDPSNRECQGRQKAKSLTDDEIHAGWLSCRSPSADAFSTAGKLLASLATREGWTADAQPSLVHHALLAASCRESGVILITRDCDFGQFRNLLRGWWFVAPWPQVS